MDRSRSAAVRRVAASTLLLAGASAQQPADPLRFSFWQRGDHRPCDPTDALCDAAKWQYLKQRPVLALRGGADGCSAATGTCDPSSNTADLDALRNELGHEFSAALDRNEADHAKDCDTSCEHFFCGERSAFGPVVAPEVKSLHMGSVPPEDFAGAFQFPLDLIKVTSSPLIPAEEAERVVATALTEGLANNEYTSGKYKLGGDWVKKMPKTLEWFNERLRTTIFPAAAALFPEVVSGPEVLRAHSVALLKYK